MTQPTVYAPVFNFTDYQSSHPTDPLPAASVDNELYLIAQSVAEICNNLKLIQRDDGALANGSVGAAQLATSLSIGINQVTNWLTATSYAANNFVYGPDGNIYQCLIGHVSTVFATDLAAAKWLLIVNFSTATTAAAASAAAAATSATNASTSATAAATSATNASTSATAAAASAASASANGNFWCGTAAGTANALTLTSGSALTTATIGQKFRFKVNAANTSGTVTVKVDTQATLHILKNIGAGMVALSVGDLPAGAIAEVENIDNTNVQLINVRWDGQGADVASASTLNLDTATGNNVNVSGTTTITAITLAPGRRCVTKFAGACAITAGASLILSAMFSGTTAAGDVIGWVGEAAGVVRMTAFLPASANLTTQAAGNISQLASTTAFSTRAAAAFASITGLIPSSITGSHTTASLSVSAGQAADSTGVAILYGASYSWLASNGNAINGTDAASSTLANSTTYHGFICSGGSGAGTFVSASLTPTFPTGYTTYNRRIFSFKTDSSGNPIPYTAIETEGGSLLCYLTTQTLDISTTSQGTSRILYTLNVPGGVRVQPIMRLTGETLTASQGIIITSGDETDVAPSQNVGGFTAAPGADITDSNGGAGIAIAASFFTTNTSAQIGARGTTTSMSLYGVTRGFKDFRRV